MDQDQHQDEAKRLTIHERESLEIMNGKGDLTIVEGPCTITVVRSKIQRLRKFFTHSSRHIVVHYTDGKSYNIRERSMARAADCQQDDYNLEIIEGESLHSILCKNGVLKIQPTGGNVTYMKLVDGCLVKYRVVPRGPWSLHSSRVPSAQKKSPTSINANFLVPNAPPGLTIGTSTSSSAHAPDAHTLTDPRQPSSSIQNQNRPHSFSVGTSEVDSPSSTLSSTTQKPPHSSHDNLKQPNPHPYPHPNPRLFPRKLPSPHSSQSNISGPFPIDKRPTNVPWRPVITYCRDVATAAVRSGAALPKTLGALFDPHSVDSVKEDRQWGPRRVLDNQDDEEGESDAHSCRSGYDSPMDTTGESDGSHAYANAPATALALMSLNLNAGGNITKLTRSPPSTHLPPSPPVATTPPPATASMSLPLSGSNVSRSPSSDLLQAMQASTLRSSPGPPPSHRPPTPPIYIPTTSTATTLPSTLPMKKKLMQRFASPEPARPVFRTLHQTNDMTGTGTGVGVGVGVGGIPPPPAAAASQSQCDGYGGGDGDGLWPVYHHIGHGHAVKRPRAATDIDDVYSEPTSPL